MTYSIVARDPATGEIGVAVQTGLPRVGAICPWIIAGVGAVATQALSRMSHGPSGLELMRNGHNAPEALAAVLAGDPDRESRQVGMVDASGYAASHTGKNTIRFAGHYVGEGYAVQANMMLRDTVPAAMQKAYESASGPLVVRMIAALKAAQAEGGDFRGSQSAVIKIASGDLKKNAWEGLLYDVRVDDHPAPVDELERICNRMRSYSVMNEALQLGEKGDVEGAMARFQEAVTLDPEEVQMRFWFAYDMTFDYGHFDPVREVFRDVFRKDQMWLECAVRVFEARPVEDRAGLLDQLRALV